MPEFNRNFSQGKMNKDLDERIVPVGQYRDAMNVEVSTSEGSDVGALQTLHGNIPVTPGIVPDNSYCVGSIVNNEENCIYWLVAGGEEQVVPGHFITKDYILKYNVDTGKTIYVFVDIYKVRTKLSTAVAAAENYITTTSPQGLRTGMSAVTGAGNLYIRGLNIPGSNQLFVEPGYDLTTLNAGDDLTFTSRRILNFSQFNDVTAINIVDDFIMFTDDISEPKLINIKRSIMGTGGVSAATDWFVIGEGQDAITHTRLISDRVDGLFQNDGLEIVNDPNRPFLLCAFSEEENNTTIKKSPLTPPTLVMSASLDGDTQGGFFSETTFDGFVVGTPPTTINTGTAVQLQFTTGMDLSINDFVILTNDLTENPQSFTNFDVRLQVVEVISTTEVLFNVVSIREEMSSDIQFYVLKQQVDPLFEFKFPRFGYRYKYVDGQYSAFSPFSEVAFLPGPFSMDPREGYNLGMANRLRNLKVQNYAPHPTNRPKDIVEIDILYKEERSTTVYTVKTLRRQDGIGTLLWPEDQGGLTDYIDDVTIGIRGSINITSELIHAVVPENQLLRPWDNVPRLAKAQEVSGNRLIYANYLQNYNLLDIHQTLVTPSASLNSQSVPYDVSNTRIESPLKSVKTMRTYQLGVLYKDVFGRETPVLADKEKGSLYIGKEFCADANSLVTKIANNAPNWATSFKFFMKETADEYYNLALNRWYNAEDGNVWLSFQSADRNKIDIDTFLELKKAHDRTTAVTEPARYKVLSIENEAPQYIKLARKTQGLLTNGTFGGVSNNFIGNSVQGFPIKDYMFITVRIEEFEEIFDADYIVSNAQEMSLKIRNLGGERSEWYEIARIEPGIFFGGGTDDGYKITVTEAFGDDVNFCSTANSFASRTSGLMIEITHDEYEDKPEFDGCFFVKVYRDKVLEDNVMVIDEENLTVINAYPIAYIHNYKLATQGTQNCAHTKNDAGGVMINVLDKYYEGMAGNGKPNTIGGLGSSTAHEHPFGYGNANANPYKWGHNAAAGSNQITHAWFSTKNTIAPWSTVTDPSEENGILPVDENGFTLDDNINMQSDQQDPNSDTSVLGSIFDFFGSVFEFFEGLLESVIDALLALPPVAGHRGMGKYQWGSQFWQEMCTRDDGSTGMPFIFIDDAWALTWGYTDEMVHNHYKNAAWNDDEGTNERQRIAACVKMHSAPFMGDYGTGWFTDATFDEPLTLPNGNSVNSADLLVAPWTGRSNGTGAQTVDCGRQYFSNPDDGDPEFVWNYEPTRQQDLKLGSWRNFTSGFNAPSWAQNGSNGCRGNLIDISVVGGMLGKGPGTGNLDDGSTIDNLRFMSGNGSAANNIDAELKFFEQLFIPGVRFRFREDPDQFLYRTQDHYEHYGIVNYQVQDIDAAASERNEYYRPDNKRNKFTLQVDNSFGSGPSGWIPTHNVAHDGSESLTIEIMGPYGTENGLPSDNPAVFETHPKESVDVDIYYEIGRAYPVRVSKDDDETLTFLNSSIEGHLDNAGIFTPTPGLVIVEYRFSDIAGTNSAVGLQVNLDVAAFPFIVQVGDIFRIRDSWGGAVDVSVAEVYSPGSFEILIDPNIHNKRIELPWFNCYAFGNGVESNRIRDDFNQPFITNGVKASTTLAEQYKEERRKEGLIFSGIYNSKSGVNRLNQFIQAEPITKDLNPDNGSIQKLFTRDTDIVTFCEDKVLKILSQKDALFNADGNTNVTATSKVLGQAIPFQGDFGISKNPESFAADQYRCYFTDVQRGSALRLSKDGLTPISDYGMKDWFTDKLYSLDRPRIIGSFDARKNNYNITISNRLGSANVVPYQNVNPGEMVFTGLTSGHYQNGLGHVTDEPEVPEGEALDIDDTVDVTNTSVDAPCIGDCCNHPLRGYPNPNSFGSNQNAPGTAWGFGPGSQFWSPGDIEFIGWQEPIPGGGVFNKPWWQSTALGSQAYINYVFYNDGTWIGNGTGNNGQSGIWQQNFNPSSFLTPIHPDSIGINPTDGMEGDAAGMANWDGVNCTEGGDATPPSSTDPCLNVDADGNVYWMPPEGPDALPNYSWFPELGWPCSGIVKFQGYDYVVGGYAFRLYDQNGVYAPDYFAWNSVLYPNGSSGYTDPQNDNDAHVVALNNFCTNCE